MNMIEVVFMMGGLGLVVGAAPRQRPLPPACSEIEKGFTREMAISEVSRCLQCGLICYKRTAGVPGNAEMNLSGHHA